MPRDKGELGYHKSPMRIGDALRLKKRRKKDSVLGSRPKIKQKPHRVLVAPREIVNDLMTRQRSERTGTWTEWS